MKDSILATPYAEGIEHAINDLDQQIQYVFNDALKNHGSCAILIKGLEPIGAVAILNQCNCCERHKVDKPYKYELWSEKNYADGATVKDGSVQARNIQDCSCDCRHLSRWLCRGCTV